MTPGDDYQRLVPLMEAIPAWLHALSVAGGTCYLLAILFLLGRRRAAHFALLAGVSLGLAATILGRPIIAEVGVRAVPNPSFLSAVLLPIVLPLLVALAALSGSRRELGMLPQVGSHEPTDGDEA
jgi:hypothetical protein